MSARLGLAHVFVPFFFAGVFAAVACSSSTDDGGGSGPASDSPGTTPPTTSTGTPGTPGKDAGAAAEDSGAKDGSTQDSGVDSGTDASTGPKNPGESCTKGSECKPWDCTCNNGSTFKGFKVCQSQKCATQQEACSLACLNSGGWAGP